MMQGRHILIYTGNPAVAIAAAKSCTITRTAEVIENSSPASGEARTYEVTRISWEVSISTLVLAMRDYIFKRGQSYFITCKDRTNQSDIITGTAICTSAEIVATDGNLAQGSLKFIGQDDNSLPLPAPKFDGTDYNNDYNNDYNI